MSETAAVNKVVVASGKRKKAVARAVIRPGAGRFLINGYPMELHPNSQVRSQLKVLYEALRPYSDKVDVEVTSEGGGYMGQYQASVYAIARGIYQFFDGDESIKRALLEFDPHALSGDPREKEPKKFGGKGARRRFQKSYR
ncbi:MAG: 30S ribosomal protein S9 [Candidatus Marsarchaeota archaeon]